MAFYKRTDLQLIAQAKIEDAQLLCQHRRFSNAYYLGGYAVEIGLKACIARQITSSVIPDKAFVNDIYRHELRKLVSTAGLTRALQERERQDQNSATSWALVAQWDPEVRYVSVDAYTAQLFLQAITDDNAGVLPWIKQYW